MNQQTDTLYNLNTSHSLTHKLMTRAFASSEFKNNETALIRKYSQPICIIVYVALGLWIATFVYDSVNIISNGTHHSLIFRSATHVTLFILYVPLTSIGMYLAAYISRRLMIYIRSNMIGNGQEIECGLDKQLSIGILKSLGDIYHIDARYIKLTDSFWRVHMFCPIGSPYRCELYSLLCGYLEIDYTNSAKIELDSMFNKSDGTIQSFIEEVRKGDILLFRVSKKRG